MSKPFEKYSIEIEPLYQRASCIIENARATAYKQINEALVRRNWLIGQLIVEEERKNRTIQEEQFRIIGALSQEYHSLFKIDAKTGTISLYRTDGVGMDSHKLSKLLETSNYEVALANYIDAYIVPEDQNRIRESTKLSVLNEKVPDIGLYKLGYRRNVNG